MGSSVPLTGPRSPLRRPFLIVQFPVTTRVLTWPDLTHNRYRFSPELPSTSITDTDSGSKRSMSVIVSATTVLAIGDNELRCYKCYVM